VHLVGFIVRKFITMHGHVSVKNINKLASLVQGRLCLELIVTDCISDSNRNHLQLATNVQHHCSITAKHNTCIFAIQCCMFRCNETSSDITSQKFKSFIKKTSLALSTSQHQYSCNVTTSVQL